MRISPKVSHEVSTAISAGRGMTDFRRRCWPGRNIWLSPFQTVLCEGDEKRGRTVVPPGVKLCGLVRDERGLTGPRPLAADHCFYGVILNTAP